MSGRTLRPRTRTHSPAESVPQITLVQYPGTLVTPAPAPAPKRRGRPPKSKEKRPAVQASTPPPIDIDNEAVNVLPSPSSTDEPSASVNSSIDEEVMDVDLVSENMLSPVDNHRRYNTRPSNEAHPARKFGLEKRTREDISAEADRKREEREELTARKMAALQAEKDKIEQIMAQLANVEDSLEARRALEAESEDDPADCLDMRLSPVGTEDVDITMHDVGAQQQPPKKRTNSKKTKQAEREDLRGGVSQARQVPGPASAISGTKRKLDLDISASHPQPAKKGKTKDAPGTLDPNWRDNIGAIATSGPAAGKKATSRKPRAKSTSPTHARAARSETVVSDVGFTDDDVIVNLKDAKAIVKSAAATHTPAQMATVVELTDSEDAVGQAPPKRRKSPKASTDVPNDKSLAFNKLPPWIQPRWDSGIVPTLLDMAGCYDGEDGGWEVEKDQPRFLAMIHDVIHFVYPKVRTAVLADSIIFKRARQAVIDWRRRFLLKAHKAVSTNMVAIADKRTRQLYADAASQKDGAAFWRVADIKNGPSGALLSEYVLRTFYVHRRWTAGSRYPKDGALPKAALALSCTAVQLAFGLWTATGNCQPLTQIRWTQFNNGHITRRWTNSAAIRYKCEKPHLFHQFLQAVAKLDNDPLEITRPTDTTVRDNLEDDRDFIRDPSSSEHEDNEVDEDDSGEARVEYGAEESDAVGEAEDEWGSYTA